MTKEELRQELGTINRYIDRAELDIMEGMRAGKYVSDKIVYRLEKMREAKEIHNILYK